MVADDQQLLHRVAVLPPAVREELIEDVAVVLRLDVLAAMRSVSEMHERVDVALTEKLHRIRDVCERKAAVRRHAVPAGLQMSVGEYAEDEVRLLLRLPARRRREKPARQRKKPERRQRLSHKLAPRQIHATSSIAKKIPVLAPLRGQRKFGNTCVGEGRKAGTTWMRGKVSA